MAYVNVANYRGWHVQAEIASRTATSITVNAKVYSEKGYSLDVGTRTMQFTCSAADNSPVKKTVAEQHHSGNYTTTPVSATLTGLSPGTTYSITVAYNINATLSGVKQNWWSGNISGTTLNRYTISYDANNGSSTPASQTKDEGSSINLAAKISRGDVTADNFTITFDAQTGSVSPSSIVSKKKTTFNFEKWKATDGTLYDAGAQYSTNASTVMKAQWNNNNNGTTSNLSITTPSATKSSYSNTITVTFDSHGGTAVANKTSTATTTYSNNGWYTSTGGGGDKRCGNGGSYTPTKTEKLYAYWSPSGGTYPAVSMPSISKSNETVSHVVSFNVNGGDTPAPSSQTKNATKTYTFAGWWSAATNGSRYDSGGQYSPTGSNITAHAHWTEKIGTYATVTLPNATKTKTTESATVTLSPQGGTVNNNITSLPTSRTTTYTLEGWWTHPTQGTRIGGKGESYTNPDAITLYARWNHTTSAYTKVTLPNATRSGYNFKGWSVNQNDTNGQTGDYVPTGNITLYAIWEAQNPNAATLTISEVGHTKIHFTCSCNNVTSPIFTLYYKTLNATEWSRYTVQGTGASRDDLLEGLTPGTSYLFYVEAKNADVQTLKTESTRESHTTLINIPYNLNLTVSNITKNSLKATCAATGTTNGALTKYTVYWREKPRQPLYDMAVKRLNTDNSWWARIFYHDSKQGTVLFENVEQCRNIQTADKYSRLYLLDDVIGENNIYRGKDGLFEFLLTYPNDFPDKYNRWKQLTSPCNVYTSGGKGTFVPGYDEDNGWISWNDNGWGGLERSNISTTTITNTYIDGSIGYNYWFYAIGCTTKYKKIGIPGPDSATVMGPVELWIRIDDPDTNSIQGIQEINTSANSTQFLINNLISWNKYIVCFSAENNGGRSWSASTSIQTEKDHPANIMIKNGWPYDEYEKLTYIQSSAVQWIDTEINPYSYNGRLTIDADLAFTTNNHAWQSIAGACYGEHNNNWYWSPQYHFAINADNNFVIEYPCGISANENAAYTLTSDQTAGTNRHKVNVTISENQQSIRVDGFVKESFDSVWGGANCNLYLFTRNYAHPNSSHPLTQYASNLKLYHLTIAHSLDENTKVVLRDFFPCRRKSDNKFGLYDAISQRFFTNINNQNDFSPGDHEIWNKGYLLYKKDGVWRGIQKYYIKDTNGHTWKQGL